MVNVIRYRLLVTCYLLHVISYMLLVISEGL